MSCQQVQGTGFDKAVLKESVSCFLRVKLNALVCRGDYFMHGKNLADFPLLVFVGTGKVNLHVSNDRTLTLVWQAVGQNVKGISKNWASPSFRDCLRV